MPARAIVVAAVLALGCAAPAHAGGWRWPVRGPLQGRFHYGRDPFAAGQRRGIEIGAPAGALVRSACTGHVSFAGALPRGGRAVSVVCGDLIATYLRLATVAVAPGAPLARGDRLGAVGATGLYFGARRRGLRFAYVDPLTLLGGPARGPVSVPLGRAPRAAPLWQRPPLPVRRWRVAGSAAHVGVPAAAWIGVALAALAVPGLGLRWRRRRARAAPARALRAR